MEAMKMIGPRTAPQTQAARRPGWWLAFLLLASLWPALGFSLTIYDNLDKAPAGLADVDEYSLQAQKIAPTDQSYTLASVTLKMKQSLGTGNPVVSIW